MSNADIRGRFIWHELVTTDPEAAAAFYSKVVPWKTQDSGMPSYTLWMAGKLQVGGLTGLPDNSEAGTPPHWIIYVATPDVDATVAEAERLGGKVVKGATDIPNMGRFAVLTDPQGATFAVYTPPAPPPAGSEGSGGPGEFTWHELATTDYAAAMEFYGELFGWEKGPGHDMGAMGIYQLIHHKGAEVGGIYNAQGAATPPNWLSYVRVTDCAKAATAGKTAGGRVLNGPMEVPGGSWITQLMDPQGGLFAVVESPKVAAAKPAPKATKRKAAPKAEPATAVSQPAPAAAAAKKAPRKVAKKGKKSAAKQVAVKKAAKKAVKKTKQPAKRAAARSTSAKRGKSAAKKSGSTGKRAGGRKGKRR
jgi:uncharacterized protein